MQGEHKLTLHIRFSTLSIHAPQDERVAAVCAALEPCLWRGFTSEMLARQVLGAVDRLHVVDLVAGMPGAHPDDLGHVEPVNRGRERVEVLVEFLASRQWCAITLAALCRQLLGVLDAWWLRCRWLKIELGWWTATADGPAVAVGRATAVGE